jgi:hypothetical protein
VGSTAHFLEIAYFAPGGMTCRSAQTSTDWLNARQHRRLRSTSARPVPSITVVPEHTFNGVRLSVPTAFGIVATHWPLARLSVGENGVELISGLPLRSEWYSPLNEIASVMVEGHSVVFARADGGTASFSFFSWKHEAIVAALVECGLQVEHVEGVA